MYNECPNNSVRLLRKTRKSLKRYLAVCSCISKVLCVLLQVSRTCVAEVTLNTCTGRCLESNSVVPLLTPPYYQLQCACCQPTQLEPVTRNVTCSEFSCYYIHRLFHLWIKILKKRKMNKFRAITRQNCSIF